MKIVVKHPSGLEYKSKKLNTTKKQFLKDIKWCSYYILEGEEYQYILMRTFLLESVIIITEE